MNNLKIIKGMIKLINKYFITMEVANLLINSYLKEWDHFQQIIIIIIHLLSNLTQVQGKSHLLEDLIILIINHLLRYQLILSPYLIKHYHLVATTITSDLKKADRFYQWNQLQQQDRYLVQANHLQQWMFNNFSIPINQLVHTIKQLQ